MNSIKKSPLHPGTGGKGGANGSSDSNLAVQPSESKQASRGALSERHRKELEASALTTAAIATIQWSTDHHGNLLIPYLKPDGSPETCHDGRPFLRKKPAWSDERLATNPPRYISPKGEGCRVYHSHQAIAAGNYSERINNIQIPIRIIEGEKKTEAATLHDQKRITVGIGGISSWTDRYDGGESRPLVDWDEIPMDGRTVIICPDSDARKPAVRSATKGLAELLRSKGAYVLIERLPNDLDGERLGLDDLVFRYGAGYLKQITELAHPAFVMSGRGVNANLVFHLPDEPEGKNAAFERGEYLVGMVGRNWKQSLAGERFWHQWSVTHWTEHSGHDAVESIIETFLDAQDWKCRESRVIRDLRGSLRRSIGDLPPAPTPGLIPFRNGCLRLTDQALIKHRPEHGNRWSLPFPWQPDADGAAVDAWLLDRLGDADSVAVFRAFVRSLVLGEWTKAFLELVGPSNSGKTIATNIARAAVGMTNTAASKLERLENNAQRFETAKFRGKRLALFSEAGGYSGPMEVIKAMTGGDEISAEIKGSMAPADFTFFGGVIITTNQPIRPVDSSGAVINRRRSLYFTKVVAARDEREILEPDGAGGWRGELAAAMPGWIVSLVQMDPQEARRALARDVSSVPRMEQQLQALTESDSLADWAEQHLVWDESCVGEMAVRIGVKDQDPGSYLFPHYCRSVREQEQHPLSMRNFKPKLIDMLRDTLGLPLPQGATSAGPYRIRNCGSVIPMVRLRIKADGDALGVIRFALQRRLRNGSGTDPERTNPNHRTDGMDGTDPENSRVWEKTERSVPQYVDCEPEPIPSVPSVCPLAPERSAPVPERSQSVPPPSPPWHPIALGIHAEHPDWLPCQIALHLGPGFDHVDGRAVKAFLEART